MQIVTDRGCDISKEQLQGVKITYLPLRINLDGKVYNSGEDLQPEEFYDLLATTESLPTTSLPSPGEIEQIYRRLAEDDPEILSIHISSGLSGTYNSACLAASQIKNALIHIVDSHTLSAALGWQVEAAARAVKAGWTLERITRLVAKVSDVTDGMFTLDTLKYLIHGGRISHIKGLVASLLNIKPIIGVDKITGKYFQQGQEITFKRAIRKLVTTVEKMHPAGSSIRVQIVHGKNPEAVEILRGFLAATFDCQWLPTIAVGPVLGAHTGPGLIGLIVGPGTLSAELP